MPATRNRIVSRQAYVAGRMTMNGNSDVLTKVIPEETSVWTSTRIVVIALCFLLNMLDGTDLLIMSFIAPVLSVTWSVSPEELGVLFSASLAGMAIGCLLVAPFADRFGRRPLLLAALAVTATAMFVSGFTRNVEELMLTRLLVGIGVGTIFHAGCIT